MNHHIEVMNSNIKYPIIFYNHFFNQNRPVTSHFHKDIEVVYVVSGKLEAYIDGKNEIFHQGEMFIINSHVIHQFIFLEETHIYTYLLSIDVFNEFNIKCHTFRLRTPLDVEWLKPWLEMKNYQCLSSLDKHILMYQLYQKLIQDCLIETKKETKQNDISFILDEIEKNYDQNLTLELLAKKFHFHPNSLTRYFKKQTGTTFYQYLQKIRLKHAYYDLMHTDMKIIDIALNNGFKNVKSFEKVFKNKYQKTPTNYKKGL